MIDNINTIIYKFLWYGFVSPVVGVFSNCWYTNSLAWLALFSSLSVACLPEGRGGRWSVGRAVENYD
jgi:hypothetical protein